MADDLEQPRDRGRYAKKTPCDGCGKPVTGTHYTDDEVCGGSDGPGFFMCERKRCQAQFDGMSVEDRRTRYTAQRAKNYPWKCPSAVPGCTEERCRHVAPPT